MTEDEAWMMLSDMAVQSDKHRCALLVLLAKINSLQSEIMSLRNAEQRKARR